MNRSLPRESFRMRAELPTFSFSELNIKKIFLQKPHEWIRAVARVAIYKIKKNMLKLIHENYGAF